MGGERGDQWGELLVKVEENVIFSLIIIYKGSVNSYINLRYRRLNITI
jgi:hypothetical protein